jgi:hypothetical protein
MSRSAQTSATPARSSTVPAFVAPALATTANTLAASSGSRPSRRSRSARPVSRPRSSPRTSTTPTSITRAAVATDECTLSATAIFHPVAGRPPSRAAAADRAATSADRFPAEPPLTNTPPAPGGNPARSAIQRSAWFSAQIAPAPSIQPAAIVEDAPTTRSKSTAAFVGAPGTNAIDEGWSVEIVAGASTSAHTRRASSPPIPSGVTVAPARRVSSSPVAEPSSGCGLAIRPRA